MTSLGAPSPMSTRPSNGTNRSTATRVRVGSWHSVVTRTTFRCSSSKGYRSIRCHRRRPGRATCVTSTSTRTTSWTRTNSAHGSSRRAICPAKSCDGALGDQGHGVRAAQLARRRLRDRAGTQYHDVAWTHVDLANHLVGDLMLDAPHLGRVLPCIAFDGHRERLTRVPGVQPHRDRAPGPHTVDAAGRTLDVGRVDVAAGHDDDVLHPAADNDVSVLHQVAEVAGVVPAVLVLRREEAAHRDVAGCQRLAAQ